METVITKTDRLWMPYTALTAFALYWVSNLILWIPWSISENLGIALMLSVSPLLWSFGIYQCLKRYTGNRMTRAALSTAFIILAVSAISDFIFFGLIRGAIEHLYKPTTFFGYLYLLGLPFAVLALSGPRLDNRKPAQKKDLYCCGITGIACMLLITAIIFSHVSFSLFLV